MKTKTIFNWDFDKNIDDFQVVAENLREEGQQSRADVISYLIERVKKAESKSNKCPACGSEF